MASANKNKILVAVISVLFVASGVILYNGFAGGGGGGSIAGPIPDIAANQKEITNLLPYGDQLNFQDVQTYAEGSHEFTPEPLDPMRVGVQVGQLFVPGTTTPGSGEIQPPPTGSTGTGGPTTGIPILENPTPRRGQPTQ